MRALAALLLAAASAQAQPAGPLAAERGRLLMADRSKSLCLLCHALSAAADPNEGTLAPPLAEAAARLSPEALRERIADMRRFNPATVMPPFRSTEGLREVGSAWAGQPVLTAQQLDDLVAYLATLPP